MNTKKGLKYYGIVFLFSVIALAIYVGYLAVREGSIDFVLVTSLISVPFMFTSFLFLFDRVFAWVFPSKSKKGDSEFAFYLKRVGEIITEKCDFSIEGYRRLRGNTSFQKSLEQAYRILINGETEDFTFQFMEKKFKKDTNENIALLVVLEEVKKMMENS